MLKHDVEEYEENPDTMPEKILKTERDAKKDMRCSDMMPEKIMKVECRPSILPLNTCIYPMGVTLTHRSHITLLGPF